MTEDLRALLRADLGAERPPPLGDVVGAAIRDGRRIRRNRRWAAVAAVAAIAGLAAVAAVTLGAGGVARRPAAIAVAAPGPVLSPVSVPLIPAHPAGRAEAHTVAVQSGTVRAGGMPRKATSAAMLHLLLQLLPPGRTSHYGADFDDDLSVQLYLDDGRGPAMVRVALGESEKSDQLGDETGRFCKDTH